MQGKSISVHKRQRSRCRRSQHGFSCSLGLEVWMRRWKGDEQGAIDGTGLSPGWQNESVRRGVGRGAICTGGGPTPLCQNPSHPQISPLALLCPYFISLCNGIPTELGYQIWLEAFLTLWSILMPVCLSACWWAHGAVQGFRAVAPNLCKHGWCYSCKVHSKTQWFPRPGAVLLSSSGDRSTLSSSSLNSVSYIRSRKWIRILACVARILAFSSYLVLL